MARRKLDQYMTKYSLVDELFKGTDFQFVYPIPQKVLEPCAGEGAISNYFKYLHCPVITNDIDSSFGWDYSSDATDLDAPMWNRDFDWVITNPPYVSAEEILMNSWIKAKCGVAFLLRLSFLEPTKKRYDILDKMSENLWRVIIFNPRPSFTDDGKTDSVTSAWFVWKKALLWSMFDKLEIKYVHGWRK